MKISKKRLANKVRKLEVQNYDMRQKIKKMDKALTYLDELTTELNHALPDPEYDAWCEQNAVAVEESLARHAVRLGLKKPELTGSNLCRALKNRDDWVLVYVSDENDATAEFHKRPAIVTGATDDGRFKCGDMTWRYAVPINHKGEPLTASEVGL